MSILKYVFDNEFFQRHDIERLREDNEYQLRKARNMGSSLSELRDTVENQQANLYALHKENAELQLAVCALIAHLRLQPGWDEAGFRQVFAHLDGQDGVQDGAAPRTEGGPAGLAPRPPEPKRTEETASDGEQAEEPAFTF